MTFTFFISASSASSRSSLDMMCVLGCPAARASVLNLLGVQSKGPPKHTKTKVRRHKRTHDKPKQPPVTLTLARTHTTTVPHTRNEYRLNDRLFFVERCMHTSKGTHVEPQLVFIHQYCRATTFDLNHSENITSIEGKYKVRAFIIIWTKKYFSIST